MLIVEIQHLPAGVREVRKLACERVQCKYSGMMIKLYGNHPYSCSSGSSTNISPLCSAFTIFLQLTGTALTPKLIMKPSFLSTAKTYLWLLHKSENQSQETKVKHLSSSNLKKSSLPHHLLVQEHLERMDSFSKESFQRTSGKHRLSYIII